MKLNGSCHCGAVQIEVARRPRSLTECNCSICRRYGARWAYYKRASVRIRIGGTGVSTYRYGPGTFQYHFCRRCGCMTHYRRVGTSNDDRFAVNARMLNPDEMASIPIRKLDVRKRRS